jgi:hypothetical protein
MKVIFSKYAKQELNDAVHYYELEYEGLGRRFREEVAYSKIGSEKAKLARLVGMGTGVHSSLAKAHGRSSIQ